MSRGRRWWFRGAAIVTVAFALAAAIAQRGSAGVGPTRLVSVTFPRDCVLHIRLPLSLRLSVVTSNPRLFHVAGAGLPRDATGVCLSRGSLAALAATETPSRREMFRNGAYRGQIVAGPQGVTYAVMLDRGVLAIVHSGSENSAVAYLIEHVHGRVS